MTPTVRAQMWSERRKVAAIVSEFLDKPYAAPPERELALGLLRLGYIVEALLAEHGPEIDLLGRVITRGEQGEVIHLQETEQEGS